MNISVVRNLLVYRSCCMIGCSLETILVTVFLCVSCFSIVIPRGDTVFAVQDGVVNGELEFWLLFVWVEDGVHSFGGIGD